MHDESVIPYLKERLQKYHYVAIGEYTLTVKRPIRRLCAKLSTGPGSAS